MYYAICSLHRENTSCPVSVITMGEGGRVLEEGERVAGEGGAAIERSTESTGWQR
jgi:hypothetical protein